MYLSVFYVSVYGLFDGIAWTRLSGHFVDDFVEIGCVLYGVVLPKCMNPNFSHCTVYVIRLIHFISHRAHSSTLITVNN